MTAICDFVELPMERLLSSFRGYCADAVTTLDDADEEVQDNVAGSSQHVCPGADGIPYLAGGALTSLVQGTAPNDLDIYFHSRTFPDCVADTLGKFWCSVTPWSITRHECGMPVQFIRVVSGPPEEVVSSFDFAHCQMFVPLTSPYRAFGTYEAVEAAQCRHLIYTGSRFPVKAFLRMKKFIERGYTIDDRNYAALMDDLRKVDVNKSESLETVYNQVAWGVSS